MAVEGYYRYPTISGDTVVFVAEDDLWSVDATGGVARRLTANPGTQTAPRFSPDGATLAFVSRDEGRPDVWVMPADGGEARRLTFFGSNVTVVGWNRSGSEVLVATDRGQPFTGWLHLWRAPLDGSPVRPLGLGRGSSPSSSTWKGTWRHRCGSDGGSSSSPTTKATATCTR